MFVALLSCGNQMSLKRGCLNKLVRLINCKTKLTGGGNRERQQNNILAITSIL